MQDLQPRVWGQERECMRPLPRRQLLQQKCLQTPEVSPRELLSRGLCKP
ncbi:hypothetical protein e1003f08.tmp1 [Eimeria tenella]|uniref:Uncharacterized protein n=1 Tax=Eimeria tenella TaxID=5802 RepID=C8TDP6_EIMTE|nr:hypothetical protein e1003f08.tmp1 [Eimeria tenella]